MEDCISQASPLAIYVGWFCWIFLIVSLFWLVQSQKSKRNIVSLVVLILAHPMLWGRVATPCTTDLWHSVLLFGGLGIVVVAWEKMRPTELERNDAG